MRVQVETRKMADLQVIFGSIARTMWQQVKKATQSSQRSPKSVVVTDEPTEVYVWHDACMCERFLLDLTTGAVSRGVWVPTGESVCMRQGEHRAVSVPKGMAVLTCVWNDYMRCFKLTCQVHTDNFPRQLT